MSLEEWRTIFSGGTLISVIFVVLNYVFSRNKAKSDSIDGTRLVKDGYTLTGQRGLLSCIQASKADLYQ